jgi:hypothetical protein
MMSNQTFYKLAAFFLGTFCIVLLLLILSPFEEKAFGSDETMSFEEELRMHRQLFLKIGSSNDPGISRELKLRCREGVKEIDDYLYGEFDDPRAEYELRRDLRDINSDIRNETQGYDPYARFDEFKYIRI